MLSAKNILAGLLLMVYTISFGHSVIPQHNHLNENGEHQAETHCESDHDDHSHIQHDNHLDEGVWDFLGCLIENLHQELPADHHSCETIAIASQKVQSDRILISVPSAIIVSHIEIPVLEKTQVASVFAEAKKDGYLSSHHFRRGPPQV